MTVFVLAPFMFACGALVTEAHVLLLEIAAADKRGIAAPWWLENLPVNSMLVVGLFDGFATGIAYAIAGVPHAAVWAAITGLLGLVPFLGYVAVAALTLKLAITAATAPPLLTLGLGCFVLFCGDKIVRPMVARDATRLRFVWILMGCLGGFEVLGLVGLVVGPVLLTITRELWEQRVRDLAPPDVIDSTPPVDNSG